MKCFKCDDPVFEMTPLSVDLLSCPHCNMIFDYAHSQHIKNEIDQNGWVSFSNEKLVDQMYLYLKNQYSSLRLVKHGISQFLYKDIEGQKKVEMFLLQRKKAIESEMFEVRKAIKEIHDHWISD